MTDKRDLLIEIGTEELPPTALKRLSDAFTQGVEQGLKKSDLTYGAIKPYASPRRLAVLVESLSAAQADKEVERRGPALTAAYDDDGNVTPAAQGFAKSCGVAVEDLEKLESDKGAWLVYRSKQLGQPTAQLIPAIVNESLDKLPIPKRMRWGALKSQFVRPVHWVILLFGDQVIETEIMSVQAGRTTRGHRFHKPDALYIGEPQAYAPLLETEGRVIANFADRKEAVRAQVLEAAAGLKGQPVIDDALLEEVTGMVEWPVAVVGRFEERFLSVPKEALISTMKKNQKYFHLIDDKGGLLPYFITIANVDSRDMAVVQAGNERVVRPRLADAAFFWDQDRKGRLSDHLERLKSVVFQAKLGSVYDKSLRVSHLAGIIAKAMGANTQEAERAGLLSKCDLMSEMVGEFPELQGIMGRYYAQHDGEPLAVAEALDEQYMPRFAGDALPGGAIGQAVAIAEKLDTLIGVFGIGQIPTGDKDPFALRRAALGALRILIEQGLSLDLLVLLAEAYNGYKGTLKDPQVVEQVFTFMMDRLRAYYADSGLLPDTFEAVLARKPSQPYDFHRRVEAVDAFRALPEAQSLAAANKRISNILKKEGAENMSGEVKAGLLKEPSENKLADLVTDLEKKLAPVFAKRDYQTAMKSLAGLRASVDDFFDHVMVNVDDAAVRENRLVLLNRLRALFLEIADLSQLQG